MTDVHVTDPKAIEDFAGLLAGYNGQLDDIRSKLLAMCVNLEHDWWDGNYHDFRESFERTMLLLHGVTQQNEEHAKDLYRIAQAYRYAREQAAIR